MNYWLAWVAPLQISRTLARNGESLRAHPEAADLAPHGSIVAAPTFGLPESIGGERNWDYRYTWIRDASFTLYALMRLGYTEEAPAFMRWMEQRCRELKPGKPLQVMYRIDGGRELPEKVLKNFEGYQKSRPVRIGNAACEQFNWIFTANCSIRFLFTTNMASRSPTIFG